MTRASITCEKAGVPSVSLVCDGFLLQGQLTAKGLGTPNLPFACHPGHVNTTTDEQVRKNAAEIMLGQVVKGLTVQPADAKPVREIGKRDIVFSGTFEEVDDYFYEREWGDGLPVVPPTIEKVEEFLAFTERSADEVLGVLLPENREATIWNVAVNGILSGCRPEYMPILIAITEAMCSPEFGQENLGHTPGSETLIILSGAIIKELGFNCTQGVLRPGFRANTSVGRFFRMYLRNVAGFIPHKTDKGCYGDNFRIVLAENEDYVTSVGWEPFSVDRGFTAGDNVVTITSCTERTQCIEAGATTAEQVLKNIELRMADNNLFIQFFFKGDRTRPAVVLTPCIVDVLVKAGYTKAMVKQHFYDNARVKLDTLGTSPLRFFERAMNEGALPAQIGDSRDLDRYVQMVSSPDDFLIVVSGDPERDHVLICAQNGYFGSPVSKKIDPPPPSPSP